MFKNILLLFQQKVFVPFAHEFRVYNKFKKNGERFRYLQIKFSCISEAKLQAGIFTGLLIKELLKDKD